MAFEPKFVLQPLNELVLIVPLFKHEFVRRISFLTSSERKVFCLFSWCFIVVKTDNLALNEVNVEILLEHIVFDVLQTNF